LHILNVCPIFTVIFRTIGFVGVVHETMAVCKQDPAVNYRRIVVKHCIVIAIGLSVLWNTYRLTLGRAQVAGFICHVVVLTCTIVLWLFFRLG